MRRSTSNRTAGRLFDNPSIRGLSLGALDPYVRRQVRGTRPTILFFSAAGRTVPDFLARWVNGKGLTIVPVPDPADVEQRVLRSLPQLVVIDADGGPQGLALCARLKADSYSAIVPLAVLTSRHTTDRVQEWFTAGADEVISPLFEPTEQASRLDGLMTRTARDVAVNPSTRLPGTTEIEREIRRRMENSEQDRRAGYYFGKDRRGQLHRVPLMTLSIGIVTNQHRRFAHPAQVSELATEMKSYAKTQPGSVFVVDRRHDPELDDDGVR